MDKILFLLPYPVLSQAGTRFSFAFITLPLAAIISIFQWHSVGCAHYSHIYSCNAKILNHYRNGNYLYLMLKPVKPTPVYTVFHLQDRQQQGNICASVPGTTVSRIRKIAGIK